MYSVKAFEIQHKLNQNVQLINDCKVCPQVNNGNVMLKTVLELEVSFSNAIFKWSIFVSKVLYQYHNKF